MVTFLRYVNITRETAHRVADRLGTYLCSNGDLVFESQVGEYVELPSVRRTGPDAGDCIGVTPSVYSSSDDVMKLVNALRSITALPRSW